MGRFILLPIMAVAFVVWFATLPFAWVHDQAQKIMIPFDA